MTSGVDGVRLSYARCNGVAVQWCSGAMVQWCSGASVRTPGVKRADYASNHKPITTNHNQSQPVTTSHNQSQPITTNYNQQQPLQKMLPMLVTAAVTALRELADPPTAINICRRLMPAGQLMATMPPAEFGADYRVGHAIIPPGDLPYDARPPSATFQTTGAINIGHYQSHIAVKVKYLVRFRRL